MHSYKFLEKHDMHDMQHNSWHKICMTCQFAKLTKQASQTKQELNLGQEILAWHFY